MMSDICIFGVERVDNARDFGRIAAANAISDVYAMGGKPLLALSVLGMPINKLPTEVITEILNGGVEICKEAGIPLAGGHSIDSLEPIFGLVVAGIVDPARVARNSAAQAGDLLLLSKPLGVGVMTTALKKGLLPPEGYAEVLATMTQLNKVGQQLSGAEGVHAMTDVTGFGLAGHPLERLECLAGHLLEVAHGSGLAAVVDFRKVPVMQHALAMAQQDTFPGAVARNLESYGQSVDFDSAMPSWQQHLLVDPQTSGGLLLLHEAGCGSAAVVGQLEEGEPHCRFEPNVAVGNGGVWPSEEKDKGQDLFAICPSGLTGPYVTCVEEGQWSELKGGSACPGDENTCPQQAPNSEAVPGQGCRCKAGYFAATATATPLTCSPCGIGKYSRPGATVCTDCPSTTEPTPDRSACQCPAGTAPKQSSGEVPTPLACGDCPAGYFAAAGSSKCSPCRGYYEFSTARATACSTCPTDSYTNADHSGCQCNQGCTSGGAGSGSLLTCTCPANEPGMTCRSMRSDWEGLGGSCQCRAGYLQDGVYGGTYATPNCYGRCRNC
ncbi:hypothetical protein OEZ85_003642 [Tetradesmus obliquus]|uniref:Selenide, water dikinase n=1 Tax=Tetradesmus obliquus TaxID=3088 RepID=A0ABY8UC87_TETOB|nr:hypothetical protein OEZ85_003642 [Tetradesmus obliquus]